MRNSILFSVITILMSFTAISNEQVPGVVIYENETINVTFDVPTISFTKEWDFSRLQARAYFHDANGIKSRVTPVEAKEIQLFIESVDTIRLVSVLYRGKSGRTFARLLEEGSINVYAMEIASSNTTMNNPSHVYGGAPSPGIQPTVQVDLPCLEERLQVVTCFFKSQMKVLTPEPFGW